MFVSNILNNQIVCEEYVCKGAAYSWELNGEVYCFGFIVQTWHLRSHPSTWPLLTSGFSSQLVKEVCVLWEAISMRLTCFRLKWDHLHTDTLLPNRVHLVWLQTPPDPLPAGLSCFRKRVHLFLSQTLYIHPQALNTFVCLHLASVYPSVVLSLLMPKYVIRSEFISAEMLAQ